MRRPYTTRWDTTQVETRAARIAAHAMNLALQRQLVSGVTSVGVPRGTIDGCCPGCSPYESAAH